MGGQPAVSWLAMPAGEGGAGTEHANFLVHVLGMIPHESGYLFDLAYPNHYFYLYVRFGLYAGHSDPYGAPPWGNAPGADRSGNASAAPTFHLVSMVLEGGTPLDVTYGQ